MNALVQSAVPGNAKAVPAVIGVEQTQYLTFMLAGEMFAIGILHVKEIIGYGGLTEVPMMPECIRGVINLRGAVVPVMDLSARFGKTPAAITKRTCIVIVEVEANGERQDMGVVVDAVNAVLEIPAADIEPPPAFGARIRTDFIEGMGKVNGKFVILLDVNQVLSIDEIGAIVQARDAAAALPAA
jgi:purine-binding chemotaxis protein CheW